MGRSGELGAAVVDNAATKEQSPVPIVPPSRTEGFSTELPMRWSQYALCFVCYGLAIIQMWSAAVHRGPKHNAYVQTMDVPHSFPDSGL